MKLLQKWTAKIPEHKYAINASLLGDSNVLPWSNLGYWQAGQTDYVIACQQLADHLAQAVNLNSKDKLLDLGCGQGASLFHWQQYYQVQYLAGVELQTAHVHSIQQHLPELNAIYCASFLRLKEMHLPQKFDVLLCIDAAYHSPLGTFIENINSTLNLKARIGFHYLMWSEAWHHLNSFQRMKYRYLLKSADVDAKNLTTEFEFKSMLEDFEFKNIQIEDLSTQVFSGFAHYVEQHLNFKMHNQENTISKLDEFKIRMTAKLCQKLFKDGVVRYVQVTAEKND